MTLDILREEKEALHYFLAQLLGEHLQKTDREEILPFEGMMHEPFWPALLHYWLSPKGDFDWDSLKKLDPTASGRDFSNKHYALLQDRGQLILRKHSKKAEQKQHIERETSYLEEPVALHLEFIPAEAAKINPDPACAYLDAEKLEFPLKLRRWQEGDRFVPLGMKGEKKLSDFFTDQKMSRFDKESQWLLCCGTKIVWIVGQRIDERFKVTESTKTVYFVRLLK